MNNIFKRICTFLIVFSIAIVGMTQPASAGILLSGGSKVAKVIIKKSPELTKLAVKYAPKILAKASQLGVIADIGSVAYHAYDYEINNDRDLEKQPSKDNWN